tara:strand:- start:1229 stop:1792 length:564 start_codon:yes stop_codon:yes gene_type:complete
MIDSSSPNQPIQNYEIVNPTLEQQIATLLPSVAGYGGNLRSTNTIIPVVDVTTAAEGSTLPESLQFAMAFGSQTSYTVTNTTTTVISNTGFWRVFGNFSGNFDDASAKIAQFRLTDGSSNKILRDYGFASQEAAGTSSANTNFDFNVFLDSGESLVAQSNSTILTLFVSVRQLADKAGTLVDPSGFA